MNARSAPRRDQRGGADLPVAPLLRDARCVGAARRAFKLAAATLFVVVAALWADSSHSRATVRACPQPSVRTTDRIVRSAGVLNADIDGNKTRERVFVAERRPSDGGCAFLLVARGPRRTYAAWLREAGADSFWPTQHLPKLRKAVPIDRARGEEVVVAVASGASSASVAVFSVHHGILRRFRIPKAGEAPDAFVYGGSLAGSSTVDCVSRFRGRVANSELSTDATGRKFDVVRTLYEARGDVFRYIGSFTYRHLTRRQVASRFPELRGGGIFTGCG